MSILLVTGAGGGIGRAVCAAARNDWRVIAVGRGAATDPCAAHARVLQADATDAAQVERLFETLERDDQLPDALVHCVGSALNEPLERVAPERIDEALRVNLTSALLVLRQFAGRLRAQRRGGSAVLFSSVVAGIGVANHEVIAAAKAGVEGMARAAAASYAGIGLRVNVVAPGLTETPLTARMLASEAGRSAAARQYPLQGINQAADVAAAALWLLSPAAARITGQVIAVDGGFTAVRPLLR